MFFNALSNNFSICVVTRIVFHDGISLKKRNIKISDYRLHEEINTRKQLLPFLANCALFVMFGPVRVSNKSSNL